MLILNDRIRRAQDFATAAHQAQRRKYSGRPYIEHPLAVALMVSRFDHDEDMIVAALLHDTVEDTLVILDDVTQAFGHDVATLVSELTDVSRPSDGNRKTRKHKDLHHIAMAQPRAKTIKLMDLVHNSVSIVRHDQSFARAFLDEMAPMLDVLRGPSDLRAWELAQRIYVRARNRVHLGRAR